MLAHLAEYQALAAVSSMTGGDYRVDYDAVPACVFMDPEVGALGLTEEEAPARGEEIVTAKAYFGANGMALALGESDGFVKVVARASDKTMLGVHIMGPEASSLLGEATLAVAQKLTAVDVARTVHAHPTLCECFRDACSRLRDGA
jgi:dihydrolipoamide dehydrogenase